MGIIFSTVSTAQTTPADCTSGCTSNDVQIIGAYLSNASGVALTNYVCGSGVPVYLTLRLTTNTPRKGVSIYSDIQTVVNGVATGNSVGIVSQCFSTTLNTTGSIVTFPNPLSWTCGTQIALVGTYTAWGTGNKDFCTGTAFQCGGTPSKCHAAPVGEIIIIQTPQTGTASDSKCSTVAGSYNANFDLTSYEGTIINNPNNYTFNFYRDAAFTDEVPTTATYNATAATVTIYVKVCDAAHPDACSSATVTLTVKEKPATPSPTNNGPICAGSDLNLSTSAVANATYAWSGPGSFTSTAQNPSRSSATTAMSGSYSLIVTLNGCASGSGSTNAVVNAQPLAPTLIITQNPSLCGFATGSVSVCSPNTNYTYTRSIDGGNTFGDSKTGATISFTDLAAGTNPVIKVSNGTTGCVATANCNSAVATCPNPANPTRIQTQQTVTAEVSQQTTVKAYPNPFSDRVKFLITSSEAGNGSLEVYNMAGQKVKTVYTGFIAAGTQTFELGLPTQQVSNLVYVLRVGDKKVTGKILQINK